MEILMNCKKNEKVEIMVKIESDTYFDLDFTMLTSQNQEEAGHVSNTITAIF